MINVGSKLFYHVRDRKEEDETVDTIVVPITDDEQCILWMRKIFVITIAI